MLEVGGRNDDRIDILGLIVKLDIGDVGVDLVPDLGFDLGTGFFVKALAPKIGDRDEVEIELLVVVHEARKKRTAETVGITDAGHADAVVGAGGIKRRGYAGGKDACHARGGTFAEITTRYVIHCLFSVLCC